MSRFLWLNQKILSTNTKSIIKAYESTNLINMQNEVLDQITMLINREDSQSSYIFESFQNLVESLEN